MMQTKIFRTAVLLAGAVVFTRSMTAQQIQHSPHEMHVTETNVAVLFNFEHSQVAQSGTPGFWLKGGAADLSVTFWKGLGIAANFTGEHASNVHNNVSLGKIAVMAGPRYSFDVSKYTSTVTKKHRTEIFGEALLGGVHAFDSTFPGTGTVLSTAGAFSMQAGGGADIAIARGFGVRAFELDYVHTNLPNNAANSQNDFRIAFGVSWRR